MTVSGNEPEEETPGAGGADKIIDAVVGFSACIGEALDDLCSYGWTIGDAYVPFDPDPEDECEHDDVLFCSQSWVRVSSAQPIYDEESFGGGDCGSVMSLTLEVGVKRCITIPDEGEAPKASEVLVAAMQATQDMNAIYCAAMACEVWDSITVNTWVPTGPSGGEFGGIWTFDVQV